MSAADGIEEIQILLTGLRTSAYGTPEAIAALPSAIPDSLKDTTVFLIFLFVQFCFNWFSRLLVIEPLLQRLNFREKMMEKFAQSFMEMIFYGGYTILGLFVVLRQPWIWPSEQWWIGWMSGGHLMMRSDLRCYYLAYGARYVAGLVSVFLEHKRKDFVEMVVHHATTVLLIYISYTYGWNRIGCVIMLILDPADTCLHTAKMFKYSSDSLDKRHRRKALWQNCADAWFVIFTLVWIITRLTMYPYVCWSAHFETIPHFPRDNAAYAALLLLDILLVLQLYWSYLIAKGIYRMFTAGGVEDPRSDSDVSDVGEDDSKKSK